MLKAGNLQGVIAMLVTQQDLDSFHRFAQEKLQNGGAESIEELFDLWRIERPSAEEQAEIHAVIRQGLADIKAGRGRPADEVMSELRRKYNLPAE
jgi:predicted transcriptional regulator